MKVKTLLGVSMLMAWSAATYAAPAGFVAEKCKGEPLDIDNQTNSTLIRDHSDCNKVWVMPPNLGFAEVSSLGASGNVGFCSSMKELQTATIRYSARFNELSQENAELSRDTRRAAEQLRRARIAAGEARMDRRFQAYQDAQELFSENEERIVELIELREECTQSCDSIDNEIDSLESHRRQLRSELSRARRERNQAQRILSRAEGRVEAAQDTLNDARDAEIRTAEMIQRIQTLIFNMYGTYGKLDGGRVSVNYQSKWDENVAELERLYDKYNFQKIPTRGTRINASIVGSSSESNYLSTLPAVLDYSIAGFPYLPFGVQDTNELAALPTGLQGTLRLSVIGACPVFYENYLEDTTAPLVERTDFSDLGFGFGISADYEYPAIFNFKLEASYNLWKLYEKHMTSGSSGGFFSKKSWTNISEKSLQEETFKIKWFDEAGLYSEEQKSEMRKFIKGELMNRVLTMMATPVPATNISVTVHQPPETGAIVAARGLEQACGWYSYQCRAAGWVLRGLNAVFGSSQSSANFRQEHNMTAKEVWDETKTIWRPATTSYVEEL